MSNPSVQFTSKTQNPDIPGVSDVDPQEVWRQKDKVVLVDVRRPDEFTGELGHVPGSTLMVLDTLPQMMTELPNDRTVVFICRSGGRSGKAAAFAQQNGLTDVYNMKGGMLRWNELGLTVEGRNT